MGSSFRNPKDFRQRVPLPGGAGGRDRSLEGITPILYERDSLRAADPAVAVWVVEGEKDVGCGRWVHRHMQCDGGR